MSLTIVSQEAARSQKMAAALLGLCRYCTKTWKHNGHRYLPKYRWHWFACIFILSASRAFVVLEEKLTRVAVQDPSLRLQPTRSEHIRLRMKESRDTVEAPPC